MADARRPTLEQQRWGACTSPDGDPQATPIQRRRICRTPVGRMVDNGRYIIRQATSRTGSAIQCVAHDLVGDIDVKLDLSLPRGPIGYRVADSALTTRRDLPDLYSFATTGEQIKCPPVEAPLRQLLRRLWSALAGLFRTR